MQEALLAAATAVAGRRACPTNPGGWLIQVASPPHDRPAAAARQARRRREDARRRRRAATTCGRRPSRDDTLALLFMCCHPALTPAVGDRPDAAGGRRPDHGRDRQRVPGARGDDGPADQPRQADASRRPACRSRMPDAATSAAERLRSVLHVLYLIFNEGYATQQRRRPRPHRAVRRGDPPRRARVHAALPDDAEVAGLLALMLLTDARRPARTGPRRRADPARRAGPHALGPRR